MPGQVIQPTNVTGGAFAGGAVNGNPCFTGWLPVTGGTITIQCIDVSCVAPPVVYTLPNHLCLSPAAGGGVTLTTAGGGVSATTAAPPPPSPPPPPPPPSCSVSSAVGPEYTVLSADAPDGTVSLDNQLAAENQGTYPTYVANVAGGGQVAVIDLSGQQPPQAPESGWLYIGDSTTASLLLSGCNIYAFPPEPPKPDDSGTLTDGGQAFGTASMPDMPVDVELIPPGAVEADAGGAGIPVPGSAAEAAAAIKACLPASSILQAIAGKTIAQLLYDAGLVDAEGHILWFEKTWQANHAKTGWLDQLSLYLSTVLARAEVSAISGVSWVQKVFPALTGCQAPDAATAAVISALLGFVRRWLSDLPPSITRAWDIYSEWACPNNIPGSEWANEAFARSAITEDDWRCLVRANGMQREWQLADVYMRGQKVTEDALIQLERRGILSTILGNEEIPETLEMELKTRGWIDPTERVKLVRSTEWVPSPQDAIQWMLKDVADPAIQTTFLLDAEFAQKYQGPVKDAFDANGVSKEAADNLWRAHWRNVSPHQLYEMHKRLRPGWTTLMSDAEAMAFVEAICPAAPDTMTPEAFDARPTSNGWPVPTYCDEIDNATSAKQYLESIVTTGAHVDTALGQDDFPPFWRPRLLALSYNVLTRVDARRAYEIGVFDDAKLTSVLQDRGYKPTDAVALTAFYHANLVQKFARSSAAKEWITLPYQTDLLKSVLVADGLRPDLFPEVMVILEIKRNVYKVVQKLKQLKKQTSNGRITQQQALDGVTAALLGAVQ